jgi:hypothetical protein
VRQTDNVWKWNRQHDTVQLLLSLTNVKLVPSSTPHPLEQRTVDRTCRKLHPRSTQLSSIEYHPLLSSFIYCLCHFPPSTLPLHCPRPHAHTVTGHICDIIAPHLVHSIIAISAPHSLISCPHHLRPLFGLIRWWRRSTVLHCSRLCSREGPAPHHLTPPLSRAHHRHDTTTTHHPRHHPVHSPSSCSLPPPLRPRLHLPHGLSTSQSPLQGSVREGCTAVDEGQLH